MNKISSALLSISLMCTAGLALAMEPMEKGGAMEHNAMAKEPMKNEGAMMKATPKKMKKQGDKMEQGGKMEHSGSMSMEPKK